MNAAFKTTLSVATIVALSFACGPEEELDAPPLTWETFRAQVYQEPQSGIFIADGDIPFENEAQLRAFFDAEVGGWQRTYEAFLEGRASWVGQSHSPLIVNRVGSADDRWPHTKQRDLTYCVSTSFGANHAIVVNAMRQAAADWSNQGSVYFRYLSQYDASCTASNTNVLFDVRPITGASYIARAFFPSYSRASRNVLINTQYIGGSGVWSLRGILRHELGHTLGFRHEHTRPEAGVCFENNSWRALTTYDSASVMHYPQCNGTQTGDLVLTARDIEGHRALYGPRAVRGHDVVDYLNRHGDLKAAFGETNWTAATNHWNAAGVAEGRRGALEFDAAYYLNRYGDLRAAFGATNYVAARSHWLNYGIAEGRRASRAFDAAFYLAHHPDLSAAYGPTNYGAAVDHWLGYGIDEGRRSAADFDVRAYLGRYGDLSAAYGPTNYGAALFHWQSWGMGEGRNPAP